MVGIEFMNPATREPDAAFAKRVQSQALENGLLLLTCGVHFNVIRFLMPLTIPDGQFNEALAILERAVAAAASA